MLFKRQKTEEKAYPFPGAERAVDGHSAVLAVESMASGVVAQSDRATAAAGRVAGAAATGVRAAAIVSRLDEITASLYAAAGKRLPCVYHLTCRTIPRHASGFHGSHDDYFAAADAGLFQLFARDAQEAADFALIAHHVAELALTPGICAQDFYRTSHSVQSVRLPGEALVREYLGDPDDTIDTPTPAQRVLFGDKRRRVARVVDLDHAAGLGGVQDSEAYLKALAAQRTYFAGPLGGMIEQAFARFGELTGRRYHAVSGYRVDDAEVVVLAQGAVVDELEAAADYVREREKIKAGVVNLSVFRPFPAAELANALAGRRVVTVLERTDRPLADTLPLTAEARAALERAAEGGARARVVTGVYGVGGELPGLAELVAVFRNMAAPSSKTTFYVGLGERATIRRFPHLQTLQQQLNRDYPERSEAMLPPAEIAEDKAADRSMELYTLSAQGGIFAANLFAEALAEEVGYGVHTFPQGGLEPSLQTATFTMVHAEGADVSRRRPGVVDTVLVSGGRLIEDVSSRARLAKGGTLIVESNRGGEGLWNGLSRRTARWIQDNALRVRLLDAAGIARETASQPSFVDQLAVWALLGAYASMQTDAERVGAIADGVRSRLSRQLGEGHYLLDDVTGAFRRGAEEARELDWSSFGTEELSAASDGEAPWTVRTGEHWQDTVFDVTRFWHSVGYLYDSGQSEHALSDPHLATGIMPARSSAFRDMSPYRLRIPEWLPENCTGCGVCWAQCPDSALPTTVQTVASLIDTAMKRSEDVGLVQMKRFSDHLVKQAYKLLAADGIHQYLDMGTLLDDAFAQLVDKLGLDDDKRVALEGEFGHVRGNLARYPIAKTDAFFNSPHESDKKSGAVLSIALNPLACTGCGVCIEVCPEAALEWADQTPERLDAALHHWNLQLALPDVSAELIADHVQEADPATDVHRLLSRDAYHSLVGGDGSYPGNSAKTAVHLVAAAVESVMAPRFDVHAEKLGGLIERLEAKIQGDISEVLKINDFDAFSRRLDRFTGAQLTPNGLASAAGDDRPPEIDPEQLRRLTRLLESLKEQRRLYAGRTRARMAMVVDSAGMRLWSGTYPYNPLPYPWMCHVPGDGLDVAAGMCDGIARAIGRELAVVRRAELELGDDYDPSRPDEASRALEEGELTDEQWDLVPPVLVMTDAATVSWDVVAALMSGRRPIQLVLVNSDGGALEGLLSISLGNPEVYVAQASVGYPGRMIRRVAEGVARGGAALFHVYAPDPVYSGLAPEKTARQARLAVEGRAFPLFVASDGRVSIDDNPALDRDWGTQELTFQEPSGAESTLETPVTVADWALGEARFQSHFTIVSKGQAGGQTKSLAEFVRMGALDREGFEPIVHVSGKNKRHAIAIVDAEIVRMTETCRDFWKHLVGRAAQAAAPAPTARPAEPAPAPEETPAPAPAAAASAHQELTERLLELCGFSGDPEFFKQSLRDFVVQRNLEGGREEDLPPSSHPEE